VAIAGMLVFKRRGSWAIIALAMGILLHQLADTMYLDPTGWFWPLFGSFRPESFSDYFGDSLIKELGSAYEWVFGLSSLTILLGYLTKGDWMVWRRLTDRSVGLMPITIGLFVFGTIEVVLGLSNSSTLDFGTTGAMYIAAIAATAGGLALELAVE